MVVSGAAFAGESITGNDLPYRDMCYKAASDSSYFQNFRSYNEYFHAIEISDGAPFAEWLTQHGSDKILKQLDAFRRLDGMGNPPLESYPVLGCFSATTLRYLVIADEICRRIQLPENPVIVEIGAGFGGQCFVLSQLMRWPRYSIYDLAEPSSLIKKVHEMLEVPNVRYLSCDDEYPEETFDLFISNYAYAECDRETQLDYFHRVIKKARRGYVIYNLNSAYYSIDSMSPGEFIYLLKEQGIEAESYEELIKTAPDHVLVVWDRTKQEFETL